MALTTSNVKRIAVERYFEGMITVSDSWRRVMRYTQADEASLRLAAYTGVPSPGTWDGTSAVTTATIDSTGATTMTYAGYGVQVKLPRLDIADLDDLVGLSAQKLGRSVASKYAELAWAIFANAFTSETIADTKALCATDHTMTSGTRSNKGTTALDRTAFLAAISAFRGWKNYQTQIHDLGDAPKFLVVPPGLEETAKQIVGSAVTSAQMQVNTAGMYNTQVIVSPYLSDANDWFVVVDPSVEAPITFWDRLPAEFRVTEDQDTLHQKLTAVFAAVVDAGPQPDGIYGASVT